MTTWQKSSSSTPQTQDVRSKETFAPDTVWGVNVILPKHIKTQQLLTVNPSQSVRSLYSNPVIKCSINTEQGAKNSEPMSYSPGSTSCLDLLDSEIRLSLICGLDSGEIHPAVTFPKSKKYQQKNPFVFRNGAASCWSQCFDRWKMSQSLLVSALIARTSQKSPQGIFRALFWGDTHSVRWIPNAVLLRLIRISIRIKWRTHTHTRTQAHARTTTAKILC